MTGETIHTQTKGDMNPKKQPLLAPRRLDWSESAWSAKPAKTLFDRWIIM